MQLRLSGISYVEINLTEICLFLLNTRIKGMYHHTQMLLFSLDIFLVCFNTRFTMALAVLKLTLDQAVLKRGGLTASQD